MERLSHIHVEGLLDFRFHLAELLLQHAVLRLEIVDHVALLLMDPAGQRDEE